MGEGAKRYRHQEKAVILKARFWERSARGETIRRKRT
jgi:hypothetical protein